MSCRIFLLLELFVAVKPLAKFNVSRRADRTFEQIPRSNAGRIA
jgi:hypothetical protein